MLKMTCWKRVCSHHSHSTHAARLRTVLEALGAKVPVTSPQLPPNLDAIILELVFARFGPCLFNSGIST